MKGFGSPRATFAFRRYARECAIHALHIAEASKISIAASLLQAFEFFESEDVQEEIYRDLATDTEEVVRDEAVVKELFEKFASALAEGVWDDKFEIDEHIAEAIPSYGMDRLAIVDKNVLRIAVWELENLPFIPPAVTINEAVEIAKKYSTAESGKFVNGVLGSLVRQSAKAEWDPATAPPDPDLSAIEQSRKRKEVPVEVEVVEEGTDDAKKAERYGIWQLRDTTTTQD